MKAKRKPYEVEAVQYLSETGFVEEVIWIEELKQQGFFHEPISEGNVLVIETSKGMAWIGNTDWLIRDAKGEIFVMKDRDFKKDYDCKIYCKRFNY